MNFLTKSVFDKLDKSAAKVTLVADKLTVGPMIGGDAHVAFPLSFSCYKTVNLNIVAKKFGAGNATFGVDFVRRGKKFCMSERMGKIEVDADNYTEYFTHFFIPFGVDEAYIVLECEGGASLSVLKMTASVDYVAHNAGSGTGSIADGGLSAYAPKNSMSAFLAAKRAGFKRVLIDVDITRDGVLIAHDGRRLSACSDGENFAINMTLEQLKKLDFGQFSGDFYKNTRISTLAEVLMQFADEGITPYIRLCAEDIPYALLAEQLSAPGFESMYVVPRDYSGAVKLKEKMPPVKFAVISEYYSTGATDGEFFSVLSEKYGEEVQMIYYAAYPEQLQKAVAAGEKMILTPVYQLDGAKLK